MGISNIIERELEKEFIIESKSELKDELITSGKNIISNLTIKPLENTFEELNRIIEKIRKRL